MHLTREFGGEHYLIVGGPTDFEVYHVDRHSETLILEASWNEETRSVVFRPRFGGSLDRFHPDLLQAVVEEAEGWNTPDQDDPAGSSDGADNG